MSRCPGRRAVARGVEPLPGASSRSPGAGSHVLSRRAMRKVPEVTVHFWITKVLTTAMALLLKALHPRRAPGSVRMNPYDLATQDAPTRSREPFIVSVIDKDTATLDVMIEARVHQSLGNKGRGDQLDFDLRPRVVRDHSD
jgi:hypothetical protein